MSHPSALDFKNIDKTYVTKSGENICALSNFTLSVSEGQIFGFAGPNGAGKSTAIKILVGLLRPSSGSAELFSHPVGTREAKKLLGFLPEVTLYHEFMNATELLDIHATLAGIPRAHRPKKCLEALERVGLADRRKSRLKEFSKGMKQRFGIAQAIVGDPKLLVLDELTSGLDPQAQASLLDLLKTLKEQGLTIFFSSHHLREIEKICDSVAIIHKGVLRCKGTLREVLGAENQIALKVRFLDSTPILEDAHQWVLNSDGTFSTRLTVEESPTLLAAISGSGHQVVSLESGRRSLEDLFLELTSVEVAA